MTVLHFYLIFSAIAILVGDNFFPIFREEYSWWLVPLLIFGIFIALVILQFLILLLIIITANTNKKLGKGEKLFRFFMYISLPIIVGIAKVKINTQGLEKLPENGRLLFVCNHQHAIDPALIYYCCPKAKISFIGKKEIDNENKLVAKIMHRLSCLLIDRDNDREAAKTIITAIKFLKEDRCSIGLFPEGHRSPDGKLQPFKLGSLKIALKGKVPVAVCVIENTTNIQKNLFKKTTEVSFSIVDVIYPEEYEDLNTTQLGEKIYSLMEEILEKSEDKKEI